MLAIHETRCGAANEANVLHDVPCVIQSFRNVALPIAFGWFGRHDEKQG